MGIYIRVFNGIKELFCKDQRYMYLVGLFASMAHIPETPTQYVCTNCKSVYVGGLSGNTSPSDQKFEPPDVCAACDNPDFIEMSKYAVSAV